MDCYNEGTFQFIRDVTMETAFSALQDKPFLSRAPRSRRSDIDMAGRATKDKDLILSQRSKSTSPNNVDVMVALQSTLADRKPALIPLPYRLIATPTRQLGSSSSPYSGLDDVVQNDVSGGDCCFRETLAKTDPQNSELMQTISQVQVKAGLPVATCTPANVPKAGPDALLPHSPHPELCPDTDWVTTSVITEQSPGLKSELPVESSVPVLPNRTDTSCSPICLLSRGLLLADTSRETQDSMKALCKKRLTKPGSKSDSCIPVGLRSLEAQNHILSEDTLATESSKHRLFRSSKILANHSSSSPSSSGCSSPPSASSIRSDTSGKCTQSSQETQVCLAWRQWSKSKLQTDEVSVAKASPVCSSTRKTPPTVAQKSSPKLGTASKLSSGPNSRNSSTGRLGVKSCLQGLPTQVIDYQSWFFGNTHLNYWNQSAQRLKSQESKQEMDGALPCEITEVKDGERDWQATATSVEGDVHPASPTSTMGRNLCEHDTGRSVLLEISSTPQDEHRCVSGMKEWYEAMTAALDQCHVTNSVQGHRDSIQFLGQEHKSSISVMKGGDYSFVGSRKASEKDNPAGEHIQACLKQRRPRSDFKSVYQATPASNSCGRPKGETDFFKASPNQLPKQTTTKTSFYQRRQQSTTKGGQPSKSHMANSPTVNKLTSLNELPLRPKAAIAKIAKKPKSETVRVKSAKGKKEMLPAPRVSSKRCQSPKKETCGQRSKVAPTVTCASLLISFKSEASKSESSSILKSIDTSATDSNKSIYFKLQQYAHLASMTETPNFSPKPEQHRTHSHFSKSSSKIVRRKKKTKSTEARLLKVANRKTANTSTTSKMKQKKPVQHRRKSTSPVKRPNSPQNCKSKKAPVSRTCSKHSVVEKPSLTPKKHGANKRKLSKTRTEHKASATVQSLDNTTACVAFMSPVTDSVSQLQQHSLVQDSSPCLEEAWPPQDAATKATEEANSGKLTKQGRDSVCLSHSLSSNVKVARNILLSGKINPHICNKTTSFRCKSCKGASVQAELDHCSFVSLKYILLFLVLLIQCLMYFCIHYT